MKIKTETHTLQGAAINSVAAQLNNAMHKGRHQKRMTRRAVQAEVDKLIGFGPSQIPRPGMIVSLMVLVVGGIWGFLWTTASLDWVACALIAVLEIIGIFLLDHVRLLQWRENSLYAGLYVAATNESTPVAGEGARGASTS
ncbi:hypothetical protein [Lentzea cavernae]|uniref:DUF3040 domain-containing protein n=1 Tax=Lentzea cavernae TaxID=2020703 RepID=A0ABQ3MU01_9PSEU|nr:hypothetical protein [Lentzea cavernae]GHH62518.1 hypothetical protein GCM10017774_90530 [Lentzea cavernae]